MQKRGVVAALGYESAWPGEVIGWRADGRPIFLIAGGAPDGDGDQGGSGGGGTGGNQGGDQGGDQGGSLFDEDGGGAGGGAGGDGGDDDGGSGGDGELSPAMQRLIEREANRIADRRINQALQRRRGGREDEDQGGDRDRGGDRGGDRGRGGQGDRSGDQARGGADGVSDADLRESRLVYREYVADEIRFIGPEERAYAADLAQSLLRDRLASGEDVESAGRGVAADVASRVQTLRRTYERGVVDRLKARGVIPQDYRVGSQPKKGEGRPGPASDFKKGEERARQIRPDRFTSQQQQ